MFDRRPDFPARRTSSYGPLLEELVLVRQVKLADHDPAAWDDAVTARRHRAA